MNHMKRLNVASGSIWEDKVGYCRCVRVGNMVEVAGTTATNIEGAIVGVGDMYMQTMFILSKIEKALHDAGASLQDVVRTRAFVTNIQLWEDFGKAHSAYFDAIRPVSTLVGVSQLIHPEMLIEIEVSAIIIQ